MNGKLQSTPRKPAVAWPIVLRALPSWVAAAYLEEEIGRNK
jgi:hypothetical protein